MDNQVIKCGRPQKGTEQLSRDRMLDAAKQLFLESGYGNLSMEAIARDAHVSMRTIYSQFGGKAGLFGALIRRCSDQFVDSIPEHCPPQEALLQFARQYLYHVTRPDVVRLRAILVGESTRFPELATQFYEQGPQRTLTYLTSFFAKHQQTGYFSATDPRFLAEQFISALRGERFQKLQLGLETTPDDQEIEHWAMHAAELFLHGCLKRG